MFKIHERLLAGDRVASAELVDAVYEPLVERLQRAFPKVRDPALIRDAVTDALMAYIEIPGSYEPSRRDLLGYLEMAARGDLLNALARTRRRDQREIPVANVELQALDGNSSLNMSAGHHESKTADTEGVVNLQAAVDTLFPEARDRELAALVVAGERSTRRFAEVLSLTHLAPDEQRRVVKQHKDRIKKRLRRSGEKADGIQP
jgi:RNA polymerase sigma-70 factor (ECF subfamily)